MYTQPMLVFIRAHGIKHAMELIEQNPYGCKMT